MRNSIFMLMAILVSASLMLGQVGAQTGQRGAGRGNAAAAPPGPSVPHDPHDLTGTWTRTNRVLTMSNDTPTMTPWAKAKFDAAKPVYGSRAVAGGLGNDPMMTCDPVGMPRYLFLEVSIYPMEFIQTSKRVRQTFDWGAVYGRIWRDGGKLP